MAWVEVEEEVKDEEEWVAADWVPVENADALSVGLWCHIKPAYPVSSKPVPNVGLKW